MKQNLETLRSMRPYFKRGLAVFASIVVLGCGFLVWKGPGLAKNIAVSSLQRNFAPLGIKHVEIDSVSLGWGRIYLRDIHTTTSLSAPNLTIQEMNIAISPLLKMKAVDVVGATLELKEGHKVPGSGEEWQEKVSHFGKTLEHLKRPKLPTIAMRDCLLVIPTSQGPLKIPVHATTETTVKRQQVLTIDWGEQGEYKFSGQFVLESGREGITLDIHSTNIDIQTPNFHIKAPEISLWGRFGNAEEEGHEIDGFMKLDSLTLKSLGTLKTPLEMNLTAEGTLDHLVIDELTVMAKGIETSLVELEGTFKPYELGAQLALTMQVPQLSKLWDFTPMLASHEADKVSVAGKVSLAGEILFEKGQLVASPLAIDIKEASLSRESFSLQGGAAKLVFNTMKPLVTKGPQRLSASKITTNGIDLRNVSLEGLFDGQGFFQINSFMASTLSGTLKAHRFKRVTDISYPAFQFEADFENIELADILKLTDLESLSGQAKLAGNASLRYDLKNGLDVVEAELHSVSEGGLIQYKSDMGRMEEGAFKQQEVNMAFQVLDNLNFSLFSVRISPIPGDPSEMQGIVKMLGSNPNVLNGYPFEFNIVTTGKLKDLVLNTLQHMKPPADLRELNQAIKATKEAKAAKIARNPKEAKAVKKTKFAKTTKTMRTFKKKKSKFRDRKMKDV